MALALAFASDADRSNIGEISSRNDISAYPSSSSVRILGNKQAMLGAICGDIIGSVHEGAGTKTKDFPLFVEDSRFTDDTVLTVAVAARQLFGGDYVDLFHSSSTPTRTPATAVVSSTGPGSGGVSRTRAGAMARRCG